MKSIAHRMEHVSRTRSQQRRRFQFPTYPRTQRTPIPSFPRTILYVDHTASLSGGEIALLHLLHALDPTRYTPVVVLGQDGPLLTRLRAEGIETHLLPLAPQVAHTRKDTLHPTSLLRLGAAAHSLAYIFRLARFIQERDVDLVHTNSLKADLLGGVAARLVRVPVIWHVRDRIVADYLPPAAVRAFRFLCRLLPNYIIANSQATLTTLATPPSARATVIHSGVVKKPLRVVHDGIPDGACSGEESGWSAEEAEASLEEELFVPSEPGSGPAVIGLVGRLSPWKGQHIFLEAAALVAQSYPGTRFVLIGSALFGEEGYVAGLHAQVARLGLAEVVEFTGFCSDVLSRMQSLDIVAHASTTGEPFGQVVVEGMLAGKAVVATNGGGVPEIVVEGVTGLLVPMGDAQALAGGLCALLSDPVRRQQMGREGRKRALEHFSIELTARKVEQVYEQFWADSERGDPQSRTAFRETSPQ